MNLVIGGLQLAVLLRFAYFAALLYFAFRFLLAIERGVAAHERIAEELRHLRADGARGGSGAGGT